jgi:hypothetical protein
MVVDRPVGERGQCLEKVAARSVAGAVAPIHQFLDEPPTAVDRGKQLPLDLPTLDRRRGLPDVLLAD